MCQQKTAQSNCLNFLPIYYTLGGVVNCGETVYGIGETANWGENDSLWIFFQFDAVYSKWAKIPVLVKRDISMCSTSCVVNGSVYSLWKK
jgi:hypothetical protein